MDTLDGIVPIDGLLLLSLDNSKELMEKFHRFRNMVAQLTPDDAPDDASIKTFVSLQIGLLKRLPPDYEELLRRADYIENLACQQLAPISQSAIEFVSLGRAIALINLGKPDAARAIIQTMHDRLETLEDDYTKVEVRDVQDCMDRHMSSRWDLYPEYEQKLYERHRSNQ